MRSPTLLPIRMNAADTRASSAMADWTLLTVVSRSSTTAEIETFISEVSTTRTNIAIASRMDNREVPDVEVMGGAASRRGAGTSPRPDDIAQQPEAPGPLDRGAAVGYVELAVDR